MARRSAEEWASVLRQWERSGAKLPEFAARVGVPLATLMWWRWRLSKAQRSRSKGKRAARLVSKKKTGLVPVRVVQLVPAAGVASAESAIEIVTAGAAVRVRSGFDSDALERVLVVLDRREGERC